MDDFVYSVRQTAAPTPALSFCRELAGNRSMFFKCLVMHDICCLSLADSGASTSFVSLRFLRRHSIPYRPKPSSAQLTDGTPVSVLGFVNDLCLNMSSFRWKQSFLVIDNPQFDMVWGIDFLDRFDGRISFKNRRLRIIHNSTTYAFAGL
jgi:hypothetical protein